MAQFVFQLDGLLRHREHQEQQRQRELAAAQAEMAQMQAELRGMNDVMQAGVLDLKRNHLTGSLDMNYLAAHRRYALAMQRKATTIAQRMALQQRQVEEARRNLAEAARQLKILEKLREKRRQEWAREQARKEFA